MAFRFISVGFLCFIVSAILACRSMPLLIHATLSERVLSEPHVQWSRVPNVHVGDTTKIECTLDRGNDTQLVVNLQPIWSTVVAHCHSRHELFIDFVKIESGMRVDTGVDIFDLNVTIRGHWADGQSVQATSGWITEKPHIGWTEATITSPKTPATFSVLLTRAILKALADAESQAGV